MRYLKAILYDSKGFKKEMEVSEEVIHRSYLKVAVYEPVAIYDKYPSPSDVDISVRELTFEVEDVSYRSFLGEPFPILVVLREVPSKPDKPKTECQNYKFCKYFKEGNV